MTAASEEARGYLPEKRFREVQRSVPILCVDLLPVRRAPSGDVVEFLLIERLDRNSRVGWNLVGGRVWLHERLEEAACRHLVGTLGPTFRWRQPDFARPDIVAEYEHGDGPREPFDPAQHAVSLSYLIDANRPLLAQGEAIRARWFPLESLPMDADFGFGQGVIVRRLLGLDAASR